MAEARQAGHADRGHEHTGEEQDPREDGGPMRLQLRPRDSKQTLGPWTGQLQRRQDREQRENKTDVEENQQDHLSDRSHSGADDCRDRREVGKGGR